MSQEDGDAPSDTRGAMEPPLFAASGGTGAAAEDRETSDRLGDEPGSPVDAPPGEPLVDVPPVEPLGDEPLPADEPPEDPKVRAQERCAELCQIGDVQCQPPFSPDPQFCLPACDRMATLGGTRECAALFVELSECLEEAARVARCEVDLVYVLGDVCPALFPDYVRICAGG